MRKMLNPRGATGHARGKCSIPAGQREARAGNAQSPRGFSRFRRQMLKPAWGLSSSWRWRVPARSRGLDIFRRKRPRRPADLAFSTQPGLLPSLRGRSRARIGGEGRTGQRGCTIGADWRRFLMNDHNRRSSRWLPFLLGGLILTAAASTHAGDSAEPIRDPGLLPHRGIPPRLDPGRDRAGAVARRCERLRRGRDRRPGGLHRRRAWRCTGR